MKKIIQLLIIIILLIIIAGLTILFFNPANSRNKIIGNMINDYLASTIPNYQPLTGNEQVNYDHPLLNESQEKFLTDLNVNIAQLPTEVPSEMQTCFIEKLGKEKAESIARGAIPSATDVIKAKDCLNK